MVAASARLRRSPDARAWIFLRAHAELVPMLLLAPAVAVLAAFLTVPLVYFGVQSFQTNELVPSWTLDNYTHFFAESLYLRMLGQSIWLGLQTTLLTLLLGYPLAYHLAFTRSRFKPLLLFFLISPLLVGVVIRCYGWMILLADSGLINQWLKGSGVAPGGLPLMYNTFGIVLALVHVFLPYMVLPIVIYDQMLSLYDWPFGAANAMVLLAISLVILVAYFGLVDRLSRRLSTGRIPANRWPL